MTPNSELEHATDLLEEMFYQFSGGAEDGWLDTMALSVLVDVGDFLVDQDRFEKRKDGHGRRQFYRPRQALTPEPDAGRV